MTTPITEFHEFRRNSQWYAAYWLRHGAVHPREHWVIKERLDPWRRRVVEADLRESLLAELSPELPPEPRITRSWVMPAARMPAAPPESAAGEQNQTTWYPNTSRIAASWPECAEALAAPQEIQTSPRRSYHRGAKPRGTGRWAQKRLRAAE